MNDRQPVANGKFDDVIFSMLGVDRRVDDIAKALSVPSSDIDRRIRNVLDIWPVPDDAVKKFPWELTR